MQTISSQRYTDPAIVVEKIAAGDFVVSVATLTSPEYPGGEFRLVVDGHHSLAAALEAGVEPTWTESDINYQAELDHLGLERFLEAHHGGDDFYDVETGINVF